jgi:hypothetical protein
LPNQELKFVIIGAPKAGTTSFFEYLRTHPQIHLPRWKETNFFLEPIYRRGVDWYLDWVLAGAPEGAVCGEASVRYLAGTPYVSSDPRVGAADEQVERVIPARIEAAVPGVKLIALLRDPVSRCVSEYQMALLHGDERRDPDEAIGRLLEPAALERSRRVFSPTDCYVSQSEYGRILAPYLDLFGRDRMLVMFTSELADDASAVMRRSFEFLGVDPGFVPPNLGVRYLEGAAEPRMKAMDVAALARRMRAFKPLQAAWRKLPARGRQRIWSSSYRLEKWNRKPPAEGGSRVELSEEFGERLRDHFRPDGERLASLTGLTPPWL